MQSSCWWNFYSKVYKHRQIICWDWCWPTISIFDVSIQVDRSFYALDLDSETGRFTPRQNKTRSFENMDISYPQRTRPVSKIEFFLPTGSQKDRRKLTALVLMGFVLIATLSLKPWVFLTTSVPIKMYLLLSLKRTFNVVARRESLMHWGDTIYRRKAPLLWKCRNANGANFSKQSELLDNRSENVFLIGVHLQLSNY